jgi:5-oxoprolinase (ATP-hydrolysing) subunit C
MDRMSLAIANALVGNRPTEAALEFAHAAGEWQIDAPGCRVAVSGGSFAITVDGVARAPFSSMTLTRGQRLHIGGASNAVWGYLAVAGGLNITPQFGSRSTHVRTGIGGWNGRAFQPGDAVPLRAELASGDPERAIDASPHQDAPYCVVMGPQDDYFDDASIGAFLAATYRVTHQMDRMAYRLDGCILKHAKGYNIITDGVVPGCIQVPGSGIPIVLMRDAPTVGGYPKIGVIVEADLGRLAQQRPGASVRFQAVSHVEAQVIRQRFLARMQIIAEDLGSPRLPLSRPG